MSIVILPRVFYVELIVRFISSSLEFTVIASTRAKVRDMRACLICHS